MRQTLYDGVWVVTSYRDGEVMVTPAVEASLEVIDDRLGGSMGVNRLMGRIEEGLPVGPLAVTLMAGAPEAMTQEAILLRHLEEADHVMVDGSGMRMSRDGLATIEFVRSGTQ